MLASFTLLLALVTATCAQVPSKEQPVRDEKEAVSLAHEYYRQAMGETNLAAKLELLEKAKILQQRAARMNPANKEPYYAQGVIQWAKCYPQVMTARARLQMRPEMPGPITYANVRDDLRARCALDNGMAQLKRALEIDPSYSDAMTYLSLLLRLKAELAVSTEEYGRYLATADTWARRAQQAKKK